MRTFVEVFLPHTKDLSLWHKCPCEYRHLVRRTDADGKRGFLNVYLKEIAPVSSKLLWLNSVSGSIAARGFPDFYENQSIN